VPEDRMARQIADQRQARERYAELAKSRGRLTLEDVLELRLAGLGVPVLYKLPLGHGKHLASIPLGVRYTLDADARTLTVDESPFQT